MGKSTWQIRNENEEFYLKTYASKITRRYKWWGVCFLIFWLAELAFMKLSNDMLYYYKLAKTKDLDYLEVKEWVVNQIRSRFLLDPINIVIVIMFIIMLFIFIRLWKIRSYELHKYWNKMRYLPLLTALFGNIIILVLLRNKKTPVILVNVIVALVETAPLIFCVRLLFPLEMKESEKKLWNVLDLAGKLIERL